MSKKVKINGVWVTMKDEDVAEGEATPATPAEGDEDKALLGKASEIAKTIAQQAMAQIGDTSGLSKRVDRLMDHMYGGDAKLKKILNGKDLYAKDELTKEEKIVGFFHALVSKNEVAAKALSEGVAADGGLLFPNEFFEELVRNIAEVAVMRNFVRVIPMRRDAMDITSLASGPKVYWTAENAAKTTTTASFGTQTLTARKAAAIIYSSDELIEDSDIFDVVQTIIQLFSEAVADEEERVIWVGNGTTQPTGIETARAAGTIASIATVGAGDFDDIIALTYGLPAVYRTNGVYFANSRTVRDIAKLKDTNGQYIWQPSQQVGSPDRLYGKPLVTVDYCPDRTVFFGDWKKAYFLGDRKRMSVKVTQDTETAFTKDQTAIRVVFRIAGAVVLGNAARALTGF